MRLILTVTICLIDFYLLFSQGGIILTNGTKIDFTKFKSSGNQLTIHNGKEKTLVDLIQVKGYYNNWENIFYFNKPVLPLKNFPQNDYHFITLVTEGKINLYKKISITTVPGATHQYQMIYEDTDYYIEKGDRLEFILEPHLVNNKTKNLSILNSFISDNQNILNSLNDEFKLNSKSLINTIRNYNLQEFDSVNSINRNSDSTKLLFYRAGKNITTNLVERTRYNQLSDDDITIHIFNKVYTIKMYDWLETIIPSNQLVKVCFGENKSFCELISGNNFFTLHFEISLTKDSEYLLERKTLEDYQIILTRLQDYNRKYRTKNK